MGKLAALTLQKEQIQILFGKDDSATAFQVSFLDILDGVAGCNNKLLLMGANCAETSPAMYSYVKNVVSELETIEADVYDIGGKRIIVKYN